MGIGAKDQTNYLVAGSSRNVSQDSGGAVGGCSREDVDFVNKLRMCFVEWWYFGAALTHSITPTSGQIVVSMICKKQRSWKQDKQPKTEQARKHMLKS